MLRIITQLGELERRLISRSVQYQLTDNSFPESADVTDVQIITLAQWLRELAFDRAWREVESPTEVETRACEMLENELTTAQEFVEVTDRGIQVGVNFSKITDEAVDYAISLLCQLPSLKLGTTRYFGEEVQVDAKCK